jgi:hypothetical protein
MSIIFLAILHKSIKKAALIVAGLAASKGTW